MVRRGGGVSVLVVVVHEEAPSTVLQYRRFFVAHLYVPRRTSPQKAFEAVLLGTRIPGEGMRQRPDFSPRATTATIGVNTGPDHP